MKLIKVDDIPPKPWKNGGGVTREIALDADDRSVIWRLSVADVGGDGPFSIFGGMARVLTVIDGAGLRLVHADGVLLARPREPVRFSGDTLIEGALIDGPLRDFNLIYDPTRVTMDVVALKAGSYFLSGVGLLALGGGVTIGALGLTAPDFALFETDAPQTIKVMESALLVTKAQSR